MAFRMYLIVIMIFAIGCVYGKNDEQLRIGK